MVLGLLEERSEDDQTSLEDPRVVEQTAEEDVNECLNRCGAVTIGSVGGPLWGRGWCRIDTRQQYKDEYSLYWWKVEKRNSGHRRYDYRLWPRDNSCQLRARCTSDTARAILVLPNFPLRST
jgi:hypothetical protein